MDLSLLDIANRYIQVFANLDPETIMPILSDKYEHVFAPASALAPASLNRTQFTSHLKKLGDILKSFPVTAKQTWSNPLNNQVTIWADSVTHFHDHVKDSSNEEEWHYHGEYIFILTMDTSGQKIKHVLEFLDSKGTEQLRALTARARRQLETLQT